MRGIFSIIRSIPRFVPSDAYVKSFSKQWILFSRTQLDSVSTHSSRIAFEEKTGMTPRNLKGRCILDAGCGMGRFVDIVSKEPGASIVGLDLSQAVEAAYKNVGSRANVNIIQADVMNPPLSYGSFDYIYSLGVLHHTPDPKRAFFNLVPLLKNGGTIAIWVYHRYRRPPLSDLYRIVTKRMPLNMVLAICSFITRLYWLQNRFRYFLVLVPMSTEPEREKRLLDTFDWYSPRYQFKFSTDEVVGWFRQTDLGDVMQHTIPVSVSGRKR